MGCQLICGAGQFGSFFVMSKTSMDARTSRWIPPPLSAASHLPWSLNKAAGFRLRVRFRLDQLRPYDWWTIDISTRSCWSWIPKRLRLLKLDFESPDRIVSRWSLRHVQKKRTNNPGRKRQQNDKIPDTAIRTTHFRETWRLVGWRFKTTIS